MSGRSILLVDDDRNATELMRHLLAKAGFKGALKTVQDGPAALQFVDHAITAGTPPEFIIVDLSLGEIHGLDLVRELRRRLDGGSTFIAVVSASDNEADIHGAFSVGADVYLEKFPTVEDLSDVREAVCTGIRPPTAIYRLRRP